ncbi:MAG: hypothetical protein K6U08_03240 [Firmicutes bacterium]|nr:hypothetical protein [Bacillota bacterium]
MRLVCLDPDLRGTRLGEGWITPLGGPDPTRVMGRWPAAAQGYLARVADGLEPEPDAVVMPLRWPPVVETGTGAGSFYRHSIGLATDARRGGLAMPLVLTDRRPLCPGLEDILRREVAQPWMFRLEPWDPAEVAGVVASMRQTSGNTGEAPCGGPPGPRSWPRPRPEPPLPADPAAEPVSFLKRLAQHLRESSGPAEWSAEVRGVTCRLLEESRGLPGADIVVAPALESFEDFPWGAGEEVWRGLVRYCRAARLELWARSPETREEARRLFYHDLDSILSTLPVLLRLGRPLPDWNREVEQFENAGASVAAGFARKVQEVCSAREGGRLGPQEVLKELKDWLAKPGRTGERDRARALWEDLGRLGRRRAPTWKAVPVCDWVLTVFKPDDPWHDEVRKVVEAEPWPPPALSDRPARPDVHRAGSLAEAERSLRGLLAEPGAGRGRSRSGLVLVGEVLPDGSGLEFLEGLWGRVLRGDTSADWSRATYAYLTAVPDALQRAASSPYADLLPVVVKHPSESTRQRILSLIRAPAYAPRPVSAVEVWEWTRQPLEVVSGADGLPELAPSRRRAAVGVWGHPVFLTAWGFEIVRALALAGPLSPKALASHVYRRYCEWCEEAGMPDGSRLRPDEFEDLFVGRSVAWSQAEGVNEAVQECLLGTNPGSRREVTACSGRLELIRLPDRAGRSSGPGPGSRFELTGSARVVPDPGALPAPGPAGASLPPVVLVEDDEDWLREMGEAAERVTGTAPLVFKTVEE